METKENKENKKLIILIGILFAIIIGLLIALIFITSNLKKQTNSNPTPTKSTTTTTTPTNINPSSNPNQDDESSSAEAYFLNLCSSYNCKEYDMTKAKELISKYRSNNDVISDENNVVADKAKGTMVECNKVFPENIIGVDCPEDNKVKSIKYEDFISKKKELYGPSATMSKEDFEYGACGIYQYVKETDSFVLSGSQACGKGSLISTGLLEAYELNNKLYIYGYDYISGVGDIVPFLSEKIYIFNKANGKFYLEKIERI